METVSKHTRLIRRGSVYYFRCKVPVDLQDHYSPKKEIIYSLKTKDHREALQRVKVESLKQDQEFSRIRSLLAATPKTELSSTEIARLVAIYEHDVLSLDENGRVFGLSQDNLDTLNAGCEEFFYQTKDALATGDTSSIEHVTSRILKSQGIELAKDSPSRKQLSYELLKSAHRVTESIQTRNLGRVVDTPPAPAPLRIAPTQDDSQGIAFSELFSKWCTEKQATGCAKGTIKDFSTPVRRFIEVHGDMKVKDITKAHIRDFKDTMLQMPARLPKRSNTMTVPQILEEYGQDSTLPRLSAKTINDGILAAIRTLLQWAENNGYREDNPARNVKVSSPKVVEKKVLPYSIEDLNTIFRFPIYTRNERPVAGGGEAAKWLPLLGLFVGARLNELGQLYTSDIKEEDGIYYIDINSDDDKTLKTSSSRRQVPIHRELITLGFLDYVQERIKAKDIRLFPQVKSNGIQVSAAWSKWWGRYARKNGITDTRKVFHSFRHTAKDGFRNSGISEDIADRLQGHTNGSVSRNYGQGHGIKALAEAMNKLEYPGLDLSHLK